MGTSSAYDGPGRSPLLPPWADEPPAASQETHDGAETDDSHQSEPVPNINSRALSRARASFAGHASGQGGSVRTSVREYVRANRGAQNATRASRAGVRATAALTGFLSSVARQGWNQTLNEFSLSHLVGQSVNSVVSAIIDRIAPRSNLREEVIPRQAVTETLRELYHDFDLMDGIENLARMNADHINDAVRSLITNCILERFVDWVSVKWDERKFTREQIDRAEKDAHEYIRGKVEVDFGDRDILEMDWNSPEVARLMDDIFTKSHMNLETEPQ